MHYFLCSSDIAAWVNDITALTHTSMAVIHEAKIEAFSLAALITEAKPNFSF